MKLTTIPLIEAQNERHNISATGEVDGVAGFITSLRAESRGALSIFLILTLLHHKWPDLLPPSQEVDIIFDSKITVHRSDSPPRHRKCFRPRLAYSQTLSSLSPPLRVSWVKIAMNWQNTGYQKSLFQQADHQETCPMACGEIETPMHFCLCRSDIACGHKSSHLNTLQTHLISAHTSPSIRRAMIEVIASYCFLPIAHPFQPSFASSRARCISTAMEGV